MDLEVVDGVGQELARVLDEQNFSRAADVGARPLRAETLFEMGQQLGYHCHFCRLRHIHTFMTLANFWIMWGECDLVI